jgi:hypothetical protein
LTRHKIKIVLTVYDVRVGRLLVDVRLYLFHEGRMIGVGGFKPSVRLQRCFLGVANAAVLEVKIILCVGMGQ